MTTERLKAINECNEWLERLKAINEWLDTHCRKCANNDDRGTDFLNCQAECEVQKDIGIACIHYEEMAEAWVNEAIRRCNERKDNT